MRDDPNASGPSSIDRLAKEDFEHALNKAFWRSIPSWFRREKNDLIPFDEVRQRLPLRGQHYIGLRQVPLDRVIGSVGRYRDFDRAFLPKRQQTGERWMSIDRAYLQDVVLPPIEVYKLGDFYFVKDGNHRVSVARERRQAFIDAYVIEFDLTVPVDEKTDIDELIRLQEHAEFLAQTRLDQLLPEARVELSLPGQYEKLLEHIKVHRWFMGIEQQHEVPYDEAVVSWYQNVYMPLVRAIRQLNILKQFPGRTETDLYLWVIEHLWYLRDQYGQEIPPEVAAAHFAGENAARPLRRVMDVLRRLGRAVRSNHK